MNTYEHSVSLDVSRCTGCTMCLKRCPTEAIRIKDGHATIDPDRCIDCGEKVLDVLGKGTVTHGFFSNKP